MTTDQYCRACEVIHAKWPHGTCDLHQEVPWTPECYGCTTNSHSKDFDHSVFPWTCPDHTFLWIRGYGVSVAKARKLGGPHQHRCPTCEGWICCNEWPSGCPQDLPISNV